MPVTLEMRDEGDKEGLEEGGGGDAEAIGEGAVARWERSLDSSSCKSM